MFAGRQQRRRRVSESDHSAHGHQRAADDAATPARAAARHQLI